MNTDWMVVYTRDTVLGKDYQELDFFVQLRDDDGETDIAEIYLMREDLSWSWRIDETNWVSNSRDGEFWLGANGLTLGNEEPLPSGEYKLLVIDRSGQRDELTVSIRQPNADMEKLDFPRISRNKEFLKIDSEVSPLVLWFYDSQAEVVSEKYIEPGSYLLADLLSNEEKQRVTWFYAYYQDERNGYGLKTGPFLFE